MTQLTSRFSQADILDMVRDLVLQGLANANARVYLFGSWARGEQRRTSDIDIAIEHDGSLAADALILNIREILEESLVPYRVDVVDLTKAGSILAEKVRKEGILWKDYARD